jgi:tetratricopeptide (TPR) repeat protein
MSTSSQGHGHGHGGGSGDGDRDDGDQMGTHPGLPTLPRTASAPVRLQSGTFATLPPSMSSGPHRTGIISPVLVGRTAELEQLDTIFTRACDYQAPQLVTIVGAQGVGKTRLVSEWLQRLLARYPAGTTGRPRVYRGRATVNAGAYALVARLLRDRFAISESDDDAQRLEKVRVQVTDVFHDRRMTEVMHFLGKFLDLQTGENAFLRAVSFGEDSRHEEAISRTVLRRFLELDAERSPLLLVFDDLHLADDHSLGLLAELAEGLGGSPVMLIAAARPELFVRQPRWGQGNVDHTRIDLGVLDEQDTEQLLRTLLLKAEPIPATLVEDACELTSGNPFFVEELVRVFLADGTITVTAASDGERWHIDPDRAAEAELPMSVEGAIQARIAALSPSERELLERAATLGSVFWLGALVVLGRQDGGTMPPEPQPLKAGQLSSGAFGIEERARAEAILEELVERDYLLKMPDSSVPGECEYIFKHNLEHDLVLRHVSAERARRYYRRSAQWLETRMPRDEQSGEQLEYMASLYERGGDGARAAEVYLVAGDKARARYANGAAVELYERGLRLLPDEGALVRIDPLHNYGDVLQRVGRLEDALGAFRAMLEAAFRLDHVAKCGAALGRIARIHRARGEYDDAEKYLGQALALFRAAGDIRGVAGVEDDLGRLSFLRGAYGEALERHERALDLRRALADKRSIALSLHNLALAHQASGGHGQAMVRFQEALALRREVGDLQGVVHSLLAVASAWRDRDEPRRAVDVLEEARSLCERTGDRLDEAAILTRLGESLAQLSLRNDAIERLDQALELCATFGDRLIECEALRLRAEILLELGDYKSARDAGRRALELAEKLGSRSAAALAHRVLGAICSRGGFTDEDRRAADEHFRAGIGILRGLGAELELARTYHWYARVLDRRGDRDSAQRFADQAGEITERFLKIPSPDAEAGGVDHTDATAPEAGANGAASGDASETGEAGEAAVTGRYRPPDAAGPGDSVADQTMRRPRR